MIRKSITLLAGLALAFTLAACGGAKNENTTPAPDNTNQGTNGGGAATANAETIYKQNCVSCHGQNLEGVLPGNTNLQKVGGKLTRDQILTKIQNGGNGMPAFKSTLKADQIDALSDWLAAKK
jgi:cytochrome c551